MVRNSPFFVSFKFMFFFAHCFRNHFRHKRWCLSNSGIAKPKQKKLEKYEFMNCCWSISASIYLWMDFKVTKVFIDHCSWYKRRIFSSINFNLWNIQLESIIPTVSIIATVIAALPFTSSFCVAGFFRHILPPFHIHPHMICGISALGYTPIELATWKKH